MPALCLYTKKHTEKQHFHQKHLSWDESRIQAIFPSLTITQLHPRSRFVWGASEYGRFLQGGEPVLSASIIPPTQDNESDAFISQKQVEGAIKTELSGLSGWITQDLLYTSSNQQLPAGCSETFPFSRGWKTTCRSAPGFCFQATTTKIKKLCVYFWTCKTAIIHQSRVIIFTPGHVFRCELSTPAYII